MSRASGSPYEHLFANTHFTTSANDWAGLPPDNGIEVAFAGRSNAGKSSAINAIVNRSRLAFVSKTPGRTQLINFFALDGSRSLVDLPGYGFAGVPLEIKAHWGKLLADYVGARWSLRGLVLIMDIRHPLTALDQQLLSWFAPSAKPVHVLLAKCDKLTRVKAMAVLQSVQKALERDFPLCSVQLFSSVTREGVEQAQQRVAQLLDLLPVGDGAEIKTPA